MIKIVFVCDSPDEAAFCLKQYELQTTTRYAVFKVGKSFCKDRFCVFICFSVI